MALEDWAIGGEGDVTLNGVKWCATNISLTPEITDVDIDNACDFDADLRMTWGRSVPTKIRFNGEFTIDLNKNRDVLGLGAGNLFPGKEYAGTVQIYEGKTITGTWLVTGAPLSNNGVGGVWTVSIPIKSQGPCTIS